MTPNTPTAEPVKPPTSLEVTQTRKHHKYGPSRLGYLSECAAFTSTSGTSDAAEQGTFLHDLMEQMLQQVIKGKAKTTLEQVAGWVRVNHEITDEEADYLRFCCKRCDVYISRKPSAIHSEISVRALHEDGTELNHGFLDVLFVFGDIGILVDFKFGWEPVKPAKDNLQGKNYALGCFQKFRELNRIGVEFIMPKLNWVTSHLFERLQMSELHASLSEVINRAEFVQDNPTQAQQFMKPGKYCTYCALAGTCTVLANHRAKAAAKYHGLPMPVSFKGLELKTPEDVALARYWVEVIETGLGEVKSKAFEMAEANGGSISCTLPSGQVITYEVTERNSDRSLGSAVEVAEALKEICSPVEILGAAELAITKLETIAKNSLVELAKGRGEKLTKKAAWEQVESTLEAQGLLTRPDRKIRFLKLAKPTTKQIEEKN